MSPEKFADVPETGPRGQTWEPTPLQTPFQSPHFPFLQTSHGSCKGDLRPQRISPVNTTTTNFIQHTLVFTLLSVHVS